MASTAPAVTSLEAFLALPEQEGVRREFDEGEVIERGSPSRIHQILAATIIALLHRAAQSSPEQWRVAVGPGFRLSPDAVRQPDVCIARKATLDAMDVVAGNYHVGAPELVVEVVSPTDSATDIHRKTHQYLDAGARSVWIVHTDDRHVMVFRSERSIVEYRPGETITEPALLPELAIAVDEIFADLD